MYRNGDDVLSFDWRMKAVTMDEIPQGNLRYRLIYEIYVNKLRRKSRWNGLLVTMDRCYYYYDCKSIYQESITRKSSIASCNCTISKLFTMCLSIVHCSPAHCSLVYCSPVHTSDAKDIWGASTSVLSHYILHSLNHRHNFLRKIRVRVRVRVCVRVRVRVGVRVVSCWFFVLARDGSHC